MRDVACGNRSRGTRRGWCLFQYCRRVLDLQVRLGRTRQEAIAGAALANAIANVATDKGDISSRARLAEVAASLSKAIDVGQAQLLHRRALITAARTRGRKYLLLTCPSGRCEMGWAALGHVLYKVVRYSVKSEIGP